MAEAVIVAGARTPIGKLSGALAGFTAMDLGGFAIAEALSRAGVPADQVDYVLMGQVILAGQGQITARQAAVKGGIPMTVPANTINKVCLSGLNTIYLADQMIRAGDAEIVVAGGMESMTQAPHLLPGARAGFRIGDATLVDSMMYDGLTDSFDHIAMGLSTERHNEKVGITPQPATRRQRRRPRKDVWPRRSSRCRCPSARVTRSSWTPTRACARARRPSRSAR
jgi:acetyl-CoA C-acetyltransferase